MSDFKFKTIWITIGIPGAGKSTWIRNNVPQKNHININADKIRKEIFGDASIQGDGGRVFTRLFYDYRMALQNENIEHISIDNTSLKYQDRKPFYKIAESEIGEGGYEINLVYFRPDINKAKKQNVMRDRVVPDDVIDRMANSIQEPTTIEKLMYKVIEV